MAEFASDICHMHAGAVPILPIFTHGLGREGVGGGVSILTAWW